MPVVTLAMTELAEVTLDRAAWGWPTNGGPYGFASQPWATAAQILPQMCSKAASCTGPLGQAAAAMGTV